MRVEYHPLECKAMEAFLAGDRESGERIQKEFLVEIHSAMRQGEDHCSCPATDCNLHGHCVDCVLVHRGHGDHLPYCMHKMVNDRIKGLCALTENSVFDEIEKPQYLK